MPKPPQGPRRVEVNPGEWFLVAPRTILVNEYESVLGAVSKLGGENNRLAYFFTFSGKVNNEARMDAVTVAMSPEDAFELANMILNGIQLLVDQEKGESDGSQNNQG